jgi:hypothetical protein
VMYVPEGFEKWAEETVKTAMPFEHATTLATNCAREAILALEKYNKEYADKNTWFDDGGYFKFEPMDNAQINQATLMLSRYFLLLLHRRGLVGF